MNRERDAQIYMYIRLLMNVCLIKMGTVSFAEPYTLLNTIESVVII